MDVDFNVTVYYVYILLKDKKPTYIGQTIDLKKRMYTHKNDKDFDSYLILERTNSKEIALGIELNLIRYNKAFGCKLTNVVGVLPKDYISQNTFKVRNKIIKIVDHE
jgi:predicted GIY-YIG superfamily endonuclease